MQQRKQNPARVIAFAGDDQWRHDGSVLARETSEGTVISERYIYICTVKETKHPLEFDRSPEVLFQ